MITWWFRLRWRWGYGGWGWRGPQKPSGHLGGWRLPRQVSRTSLRADSYIQTVSEHLPLSFWYIILLFYLPVLSNQFSLSFHWCSDIDPSWGVRVHYDAFFLSIPIWYPYHSHLNHLHISCIYVLNGDNCTMLDSVISWNSNTEVPRWFSPLL